MHWGCKMNKGDIVYWLGMYAPVPVVIKRISDSYITFYIYIERELILMSVDKYGAVNTIEEWAKQNIEFKIEQSKFEGVE